MSGIESASTTPSPAATAAATDLVAQLRNALAEFGGLQFDIETLQTRHTELRKLISSLSAQIQQQGPAAVPTVTESK